MFDKRSRLIVLLCLILLVSLFVAGAWADDATPGTINLVAVDDNNNTTNTLPGVGEEFKVNINASSTGEGIFGLQVLLQFDPNVLEVMDAQGKAGIQILPGDIWGDGFVAQNVVDNNVGSIYFAATLMAPAEPFKNETTIATATFKVKESVGNTEITVETGTAQKGTALSDANAQPIAYVANNTVLVEQDTTPPTFIITPSPTVVEAGSPVVITITPSEELEGNPQVTVTVNGVTTEAFYNENVDGEYKYTYQTTSVQSGVATINVNATDKAGNIGTNNATTFNITAAVIPQFDIVANPETVEAGKQVEISVKPSEELKEEPTVNVSVNGIEQNVEVDYDIESDEYKGIYQTTKGQIGEATITVEGTDLAGNMGESTATFNIAAVVAPTFTIATNPQTVEACGQVEISVKPSEELIEEPTVNVSVNGIEQNVVVDYDIESDEYKGIYQTTEDQTGEATITVEGTDMDGNIGQSTGIFTIEAAVPPTFIISPDRSIVNAVYEVNIVIASSEELIDKPSVMVAVYGTEEIIDDITYDPDTNTYTGTYKNEDDLAGQATINVEGTDLVGNTGTGTASFTIANFIDITPETVINPSVINYFTGSEPLNLAHLVQEGIDNQGNPIATVTFTQTQYSGSEDGSLAMMLPADTVITGPAGWTVFNPPTVLVDDPTVEDALPDNTVALSVFEVGDEDIRLDLSKPVRILIADRSGLNAGFIRDGQFEPISKVSVADAVNYDDTENWAENYMGAKNQDDFCIDVNDDLVIWTKHFTKFIAYSTNNPTPPTSSGGGGGGSSNPYVSEYIPGKDAVAVSLDAEVSATFDTDVEVVDLTGVTIEDSNGNKVSGVSASLDGRKIIIAHENFAYNTKYTVKIPEKSVKKKNSSKNNNQINWSFTTVKENAVEALVFTDLPKTHWSYGNIERLYNSKIISGYPDNTFLPENNITRAEFTKIIVKVFGLSEQTTGEPIFTDVPKTAWYYGFVQAASNSGLVKGYVSEFQPDKLITREEMAVILVRALGVESEAKVGMNFSDAGEIASWAKDSVAIAVEEGLISGYPDNTFGPQRNATRAEVCAVSCRYMDRK